MYRCVNHSMDPDKDGIGLEIPEEELSLWSRHHPPTPLRSEEGAEAQKYK